MSYPPFSMIMTPHGSALTDIFQMMMRRREHMVVGFRASRLHCPPQSCHSTATGAGLHHWLRPVRSPVALPSIPDCLDLAFTALYITAECPQQSTDLWPFTLTPYPPLTLFCMCQMLEITVQKQRCLIASSEVETFSCTWYSYPCGMFLKMSCLWPWSGTLALLCIYRILVYFFYLILQK